MFRRLMALLLVCFVVLTGLTSPAYADSNHVSDISMGAKQNIDSHDIIIVNPTVNPYPPSPSPSSDWDNFFRNLKDGAIATAGVTLGGAALCFAIDGAATTVFPPAGVLLPYCPGFGAALGTGNIVQKGVQVAAHAL